MPPRIAIVAALPREIAGLVRGVRPDAELRERGIYLYRLPQAVVVAAGMGSERVPFAVEAARAAGEIEMLVSVGLAGACLAIEAGELLEASVVVDVSTGERFNSDADVVKPVVLATSGTIASVREKARLAGAYNALMTDMEAATVARLARAHGLKFRAIKGISDAHDFELSSLSRFTGKHGSFRTGAFALHTAFRPTSWPRAMQLGRDSSRALASLQKRLQLLIDEQA